MADGLGNIDFQSYDKYYNPGAQLMTAPGYTAGGFEGFKANVPAAPTGTLDSVTYAPGAGASSGGFDWMGKGGAIDLGAQGLGALAGGLQAYTGLQALKLAEDQFDFNKALAQTNLANQGELVRQNIGQSGAVGLALGGGALTPEQRAAAEQDIAARQAAVKKTI